MENMIFQQNTLSPLIYEPIHALALMLRKNTSTKPEPFPKIGGSPQILKIYTYGNDLPFCDSDVAR